MGAVCFSRVSRTPPRRAMNSRRRSARVSCWWRTIFRRCWPTTAGTSATRAAAEKQPPDPGGSCAIPEPRRTPPLHRFRGCDRVRCRSKGGAAPCSQPARIRNANRPRSTARVPGRWYFSPGRLFVPDVPARRAAAIRPSLRLRCHDRAWVLTPRARRSGRNPCGPFRLRLHFLHGARLWDD